MDEGPLQLRRCLVVLLAEDEGEPLNPSVIAAIELPCGK